MFGSDVVVLQPTGFVQRQFQHLLGSRSERNFLVSPLAAADGGFDLGAHAVGGNIQVLQHLAGDPLTFAADPWHVAVSLLTFADDPQQDMLGADDAVVEALRLFLSEDDHAPRPFCKPLKHRTAPSAVVFTSRWCYSYSSTRLRGPTRQERLDLWLTVRLG